MICGDIENALLARDYQPNEKVHDIAFHMTDWISDIEQWHAYCQNPESVDAEATEKLLIAFLVHVPNHVAAASKLMLDIPVADIFGVGATHDEE